jgi:hypothetical protein
MAELPQQQLKRRHMKKSLELKLLKMCEEILPNTRMANNRKLKELLEEIRNSLEGDK